MKVTSFSPALHLRVFAVGFVLWVVLFTLGLIGYTGSKIVYMLFSTVMGVMVVTGVRQMNSYGYMFLTVFLWLGFWLKLTVHIIFNYSFVEPIGLFVSSPKAWDEVLYVATAASLGVIFGKIIYALIKLRVGVLHENIRPVIPPWYIKSRKWVWILLVFISITVLFINAKYGVQLVGLAPRTILMWPLNAIVTWFLNIGLATGVAVLLWWDIGLKKDISAPIYAVLTEALFSSISILSRSAYVFHAIPQLMAAYRFKNLLIGWSRFKTIVISSMFVFLLVVSIAGVTTFRNYLYQSGAYSSTAYQVAHARWEVLTVELERLQLEIKNSSANERLRLMKIREKLETEINELLIIKARESKAYREAIASDSVRIKILMNEFGYQLTDGFLTQILHLSVDRWIGLEGLMAVQSYSKKSPSLLWHALSDKLEAGERDIFQTISNSIYLKSDITEFKFANLPGATAILYYSNSILIVMLGMLFFTLAVFITEFFINALTANPILCSLYGALMANNVSQLGVSPRQTLPYFLILICGILLVWIIQTGFFTRLFVFAKSNFFKSQNISG